MQRKEQVRGGGKDDSSYLYSHAASNEQRIYSSLSPLIPSLSPRLPDLFALMNRHANLLHTAVAAVVP